MRAGDDDNIRPLWRFVSTKQLSNQSFSEISFHRAADLPRRRNPETSDRQLSRQEKHRHVSRLNPRSSLVNTLKISASPDMFVAAERMPHGIVRAGSLFSRKQSDASALWLDDGGAHVDRSWCSSAREIHGFYDVGCGSAETFASWECLLEFAVKLGTVNISDARSTLSISDGSRQPSVYRRSPICDRFAGLFSAANRLAVVDRNESRPPGLARSRRHT